MDKRLKQRLLGAVVMVVLAVIIIPELIKEPGESNDPIAGALVPADVNEPSGVTVSLPQDTDSAGTADTSSESEVNEDSIITTAPVTETALLQPAQPSTAVAIPASPEPEPGPEPKPVIVTKPDPKPKAEPKPAPKPEPVAKPKPAPKPEPVAGNRNQRLSPSR